MKISASAQNLSKSVIAYRRAYTKRQYYRLANESVARINLKLGAMTNFAAAVILRDTIYS